MQRMKTSDLITPRPDAPFRADHVGSLLRPAELKTARRQRESGDISAADLDALENSAIQLLIAKQQAVGLKGITDGEFRRDFWHFDFLEGLGGVESSQADH